MKPAKIKPFQFADSRRLNESLTQLIGIAADTGQRTMQAICSYNNFHSALPVGLDIVINYPLVEPQCLNSSVSPRKF